MLIIKFLSEFSGQIFGSVGISDFIEKEMFFRLIHNTIALFVPFERAYVCVHLRVYVCGNQIQESSSQGF
jgi:hypothetical protein